MLAERRLGDAHLLRRASEIEMFGDSQEISQLPELDPRRVLVDVGPSALLIERRGTAGFRVAAIEVSIAEPICVRNAKCQTRQVTGFRDVRPRRFRSCA